MTRLAIEVDEFLRHPPEKVWAALTKSDAIAEWLMPNTFVEATVGHQFTLDTGKWGQTECEILRVEPPHLLQFAWRNHPLDTTVTWRLKPEGTGTRFLVEHSGFDTNDPIQRFAHDGMTDGWHNSIVTALDTHLANRTA